MSILSNDIYEKRLVLRLKGHWEMLKEGDDVPLASRFNHAAISDMWENCIRFKVISTGDKHTYNADFIGRNLQSAFGKDLSGTYFSSAQRSTLTKDFVGALDKAVDDRNFTISEGQFVNVEGRIVKFRDCIMPFQDTEAVVKMLVVGISWRSFE